MLKGTLPPHLSMGVVYREIVPFFLLQAVGLAIAMAFPGLMAILPTLMDK